MDICVVLCTAPRLCDSCLASSGKRSCRFMNYRNFGTSAAWPLTVLSHEDYLRLEAVPSPWVSVEGFRLGSVSWDLLHLIFLGHGRDLVASAIRVIIREGCYDYVCYDYVGSNQLDAILSVVHKEIHDTCTKNGPLGPCPDILYCQLSFYFFGMRS